MRGVGRAPRSQTSFAAFALRSPQRMVPMHVAADRRANWHGCFEKSELIQRVMDTTPRGVAPCRTVGCAWKAAYMAAEADRWRTAVTKEDLVGAEWALVMGGRWLYTNHRGFRPDFTFNSIVSGQVFDFRINTSTNQVRAAHLVVLRCQRARVHVTWRRSRCVHRDISMHACCKPCGLTPGGAVVAIVAVPRLSSGPTLHCP